MILMILAPLVGVLGLFCSHSVPGYLPALATGGILCLLWSWLVSRPFR